VPDPNNAGEVIANEDLETYPYVIDALEKEGFRAVQVAAGDSISVAVDENGDIRAWGSFRVSPSRALVQTELELTLRATKANSASIRLSVATHSNSPPSPCPD
jgi:alpha-tubulin suppressor-like RCC1 family protein